MGRYRSKDYHGNDGDIHTVECTDCGAIVGNRGAHDAFHDLVDDISETAFEASAEARRASIFHTPLK